MVCLPPVAQGDVYRAAQRRPQAIGIIDGYFSGAPSVWHKEILWAMSRGIPVFGSASMGALRAAELHAFGMRGVGRIFEAFRDGELEDDDEVAVVHGPAELGHIQASEAMVNIRATLARAETEGVLSKSSRGALEAFGKSMFFPQRSWQALLEGAATLGVAESERAALSAWLTNGRVDQKRADALEMLAAMREALLGSIEEAPKFNFEWTYFWDEFVRRFEAGHESPGASPQQRVIEELRLEGPDAYARVEAMALLRMVAASGATPMAPSPAPENLQATLRDIRARLGLFTRAELDRWMARNDLDVVSMERLIADQAGLAILRERSSAALGPHHPRASCASAAPMSGSPNGRAGKATCSRRCLPGGRARRQVRKPWRCGFGISSSAFSCDCPMTSRILPAGSALRTSQTSMRRCFGSVSISTSRRPIKALDVSEDLISLKHIIW